MKSLPGYFEHVRNKTYIDRYPETVIQIDNLKDKLLVEFGGGLGNDVLWLVGKGPSPKNIFFIEKDEEVFNQAFKKLKDIFGPYASHLVLGDARRTSW